ncbi:MAG TPA: CarD family transcriptional regulator [Candidatus Caccousia avistercoris]|nr:CarD family transcriptional regulator [Candidatus Caccousia avistercoris]
MVRMVFHVNDVVAYGSNGIFRITAITKQKIGKTEMEYYVLKPVYERGGSTIYVPTGNPRLAHKLRSVLSEQEVYELLNQLSAAPVSWIESQEDRKELYKKILSEGNQRDMMRAVRALHLRQEEQQAKGKRLYLADERFLKEAEKLLCYEFAAALHMEPNQIPSLITEKLHIS